MTFLSVTIGAGVGVGVLEGLWMQLQDWHEQETKVWILEINQVRMVRMKRRPHGSRRNGAAESCEFSINCSEISKQITRCFVLFEFPSGQKADSKTYASSFDSPKLWNSAIR
ncbi:hypothetical protein EJB05_26968, partial [Eragrostis curvula]